MRKLWVFVKNWGLIRPFNLMNMEKKKNVPTLRFPDFTEEWGIIKLGELIEEKIEFPDKELPLYSLTIEEGVIPKSARYERAFLVKSEESAYKVMSENDFAYNPMNLRFGALARYKGDGKVLVSKYYNIFRCNEKVALKFIESYLTSYNMIQFYNKMATGSLEEKKRVHFSDFIHFNRRFPSLPEQQKIAAFLTVIDTRIQHLTRKKALLEQYKKGVMQNIFSREVRFRDEEGKEFPEWEVKRLEEICTINPKNQDLPESFIYIDLESVEKGVLNKEEIVRRSEAPSRAQRLLKNGDILFQMVRPYQKNNYFFEKGDGYVASTGYAQLRTKNNAKYLYQFLHTEQFIQKVLVRCTGSNYPAINSNDLSKIRISLPILAEQQKIATFLSALDAKINQMSNQVARTQAYKKGLLQQMFV